MSMSESSNIIQMNNDHIPESDESDEDFDLDDEEDDTYGAVIVHPRNQIPQKH